MDPNAKLAKGFENLTDFAHAAARVLLKEQELADIPRVSRHVEDAAERRRHGAGEETQPVRVIMKKLFRHRFGCLVGAVARRPTRLTP